MNKKFLIIINIVLMCLCSKYNNVFAVETPFCNQKSIYKYQIVFENFDSGTYSHSDHVNHSEPFEHSIGHCHGCLNFIIVSDDNKFDFFANEIKYFFNNSYNYAYNPLFNLKRPPKSYLI